MGFKDEIIDRLVAPGVDETKVETFVYEYEGFTYRAIETDGRKLTANGPMITVRTARSLQDNKYIVDATRYEGEMRFDSAEEFFHEWSRRQHRFVQSCGEPWSSRKVS